MNFLDELKNTGNEPKLHPKWLLLGLVIFIILFSYAWWLYTRADLESIVNTPSHVGVQNRLLNVDESIYIPISKAEFAVMNSTFNVWSIYSTVLFYFSLLSLEENATYRKSSMTYNLFYTCSHWTCSKKMFHNLFLTQSHYSIIFSMLLIHCPPS